LASDTPASATVITDTTATTGNAQANVSFVKVNFTAAADGDVKVTNLKFKRTGISSDTDLDGLYLYDGATRLTDASSISSNYVTFNNASGLFTVTKGTTKTITLSGDMYFKSTSGKTIGFNLVAATDVTTNGATVSGTFPMAGNLMSTAVATDLGKITFSGYNYPSSAAVKTDINAANDQEVFRFTMASTNQELKVEKLKLTAVGSIQLADLKNFKLLVSGVQVGSTVAAMESGNTVTFDMSAAPLVVTKGGSKTVSMRADIVSGSTRTFYFSFQNQQDIIVKDASYNVYIEPYVGGTFTVIRTATLGWYEIAAGSLAISKSSSSPTADVAVDATNQTLAIFDFTAAGEDAKVQNLNVSANITGAHGDGGILNGKVIVDGAKDTAANSQLGTTKNLTDSATVASVNFTFGSTFIVKAGTTAKVKIVGDIKTTSSTSFTGGETVKITLVTGSSNVQTMTSLNTLNRPAADTAASTLTITSVALTATKYSTFLNQTVAAGTNDAKLASFVVGAGAAEGVTVSSITVTLSTDNSNSSTISRMYMKDHATDAAIGDVKSSISTSNVYTVNFSLAASNGKVVDLYGDIKSSTQVGPWVANISVDGTGLNTNKAVSGGSTTNAMQTITIGSGALTTTNGAKPTAAILLGGSTGNYMAQYTFSATNEGFTIDKLKLKVPNNFATSTSAITIKYKDKAGAAQQQTQVLAFADADVYATATYTGLTVYVPANDSTNLDVYVDLGSIGTGAGASGAAGAITLDWNEGFNATGDSGTPQTDIGSSGSADLSNNTFYVRKSKPTFAKLDAGTDPNTKLYRFSVVADNAGNIDLKQLAFNIVTSGCDVTQVYLYNPVASSQLTTDKVDPTGNATSGNVSLLIGAIDDTVETIGTTATIYEVKGTVTSFTKNTDTVSVTFKQDAAVGATAGANTVGASSTTTWTADKGNIWSDRSSAAHTTATLDWTNGFLLKDMSQAASF